MPEASAGRGKGPFSARPLHPLRRREAVVGTPHRGEWFKVALVLQTGEDGSNVARDRLLQNVLVDGSKGIAYGEKNFSVRLHWVVDDSMAPLHPFLRSPIPNRHRTRVLQQSQASDTRAVCPGDCLRNEDFPPETRPIWRK